MPASTMFSVLVLGIAATALAANPALRTEDGNIILEAQDVEFKNDGAVGPLDVHGVVHT